MKNKRKLFTIFLIIFLIVSIININSLTLGNQISNPNEKIDNDDEQDYNGYIIQFNDEPVLNYKHQLKDRLKNLFSQITNKALDVILNQNIQNYKEKIFSIHRKAKEDILNLLGRDLSSEKFYSIEFTDLFNGIKIKDSSLENIEKIKSLPYVKKVFPDYKISIALDTSIPQINADDIWSYHDNSGKSITGEGISIAIIDTGVDYNHPDLKDNYVKGYDFVNNDEDPKDDHGHGTHCAGIALGTGRSSDYQYVGVAPEANLYCYKVLDSTGGGYGSWLIAAMEQAILDDVDIISLSLGDSDDSANPDDELSEAADNAVKEGVIVIAAAGNNGSSGPISSPGCARNVTCVGASDFNDQIAYFSSWGPVEWNNKTLMKPDLVAPGVSIKSTRKGGGYAIKSGTSMSTPHVAGAAALILQVNPDLTPEEVKKALKENADDIGYEENAQGSGRINVSASINITQDIIIKSPYRVSEGKNFSVSLFDNNNNSLESFILITIPYHLPRFKYGSSVNFNAPIILNPMKTSLKSRIFIFNFKKQIKKEVEIVVTNS